jgi:hypothetical protein
MKLLRTLVSSVLFVSTLYGDSEIVERLDLERFLTDPTALAKLVIEYEPGDSTTVFVYGNGRLVKQARPLISDALVPTCSGKISQEEVKDLIRSFISHQFFDLPTRSYAYMTVNDDSDDFWKALKLHSITIDDGKTRASRQFAEGIYEGRKEPIPMDFTAIEDALRSIEHEATEGKPCRLSPGIKLPPAHWPQPVRSAVPS